MKMKCSLTCAEITFAEMIFVDEKCWLRCWMKCWLKCCLKCWSRFYLTIWWVLSRLHPTLMMRQMYRRSNALTSLRICQKNCIWRWGCQMHWRVFDVVKRLHLTLKRSDALTNFRFCQKTASDSKTITYTDEFSVYLSENCIWLWNNQMHWRIFCVFVRKLHLTMKRSNALTNFRFFARKLHFNDEIHWRISDIVKKTALWRSNALVNFR